MGTEYITKCSKCGREFRARSGGGFLFFLFHCGRCGREKEVSFDEINSYTGKDKRFTKTGINAAGSIAGTCSFGGHFEMDAPIRCPECRSDNIEHIRDVMLYD